MQYFYKFILFPCLLFVTICYADIQIELKNKPKNLNIKVSELELFFCYDISRIFNVINSHEPFKINTDSLPNTCLRKIRIIYSYREKVNNGAKQNTNDTKTINITFYVNKIPINKIQTINIDMKNSILSFFSISTGVSYVEKKSNDSFIMSIYKYFLWDNHNCTNEC
ncbi:MAG: hypothetical protein HRT87_03170 [Legionellales bacterium]|nr:hypothetical protein [Legionellales bacterium]